MKIVIDIPEDRYDEIHSLKFVMYGLQSEENRKLFYRLINAVQDGTPIPDNVTNGKEVLIKYCLEHSGEEIYDLLKQTFDASMNWTDSRSFIIEWLEKGVRK